MKIDKVYVGVIAVLVLIIAYLVVQSNQAVTDQANKQHAADAVKTLYELQYEKSAEILKIDDLYGIYRMTVRFTDYANQQQAQDVFVTKDGQLLTDRALIIETYRTFLDNDKKFIDCLNSKNVRIAGQTNDTATIQQLNLLGTYSYKLFVSCDGANEQTCNNLGITRYPTTVYNNTPYTNIFNTDFFSQLTGCQLQQ